jgi:hypothetical protein
MIAALLPVLTDPKRAGMQEKRAKGRRRWDLFPEFPLKDSNGVIVISNRRRVCDRRLDNTSLEQRLLMLSEMPPPTLDGGNNH